MSDLLEALFRGIFWVFRWLIVDLFIELIFHGIVDSFISWHERSKTRQWRREEKRRAKRDPAHGEGA